MWAYPNADFESIVFEKDVGEVVNTYHYGGLLFTRYGGNDPSLIIEAIEAFFDVSLVSEHEDEFYEIISKKTSQT